MSVFLSNMRPSQQRNDLEMLDDYIRICECHDREPTFAGFARFREGVIGGRARRLKSKKLMLY